jgi:hypothetical protein
VASNVQNQVPRVNGGICVRTWYVVRRTCPQWPCRSVGLVELNLCSTKILRLQKPAKNPANTAATSRRTTYYIPLLSPFQLEPVPDARRLAAVVEHLRFDQEPGLVDADQQIVEASQRAFGTGILERRVTASELDGVPWAAASSAHDECLAVSLESLVGMDMTGEVEPCLRRGQERLCEHRRYPAVERVAAVGIGRVVRGDDDATDLRVGVELLDKREIVPMLVRDLPAGEPIEVRVERHDRDRWQTEQSRPYKWLPGKALDEMLERPATCPPVVLVVAEQSMDGNPRFGDRLDDPVEVTPACRVLPIADLVAEQQQKVRLLLDDLADQRFPLGIVLAAAENLRFDQARSLDIAERDDLRDRSFIWSDQPTGGVPPRAAPSLGRGNGEQQTGKQMRVTQRRFSG